MIEAEVHNDVQSSERTPSLISTDKSVFNESTMAPASGMTGFWPGEKGEPDDTLGGPTKKMPNKVHTILLAGIYDEELMMRVARMLESKPLQAKALLEQMLLYRQKAGLAEIKVAGIYPVRNHQKWRTMSDEVKDQILTEIWWYEALGGKQIRPGWTPMLEMAEVLFPGLNEERLGEVCYEIKEKARANRMSRQRIKLIDQLQKVCRMVIMETDRNPWEPDLDRERLTTWVARILAQGNEKDHQELLRDAQTYWSWKKAKASGVAWMGKFRRRVLREPKIPQWVDVMDVAAALLIEERARIKIRVPMKDTLAEQVIDILLSDDQEARKQMKLACDGVHALLGKARRPPPVSTPEELEKMLMTGEQDPDDCEEIVDQELPTDMVFWIQSEQLTDQAVIEIVKGDIVESAETLVFEMSQDFAMNTGVMKYVKRKYLQYKNNEHELFQKRPEVGQILSLDEHNTPEGNRVYFLIDRKRASDDVTEKAFDECLWNLRNDAFMRGNMQLNMPRLGMSVGQSLPWKKMCGMVKQIFRGSAVSIKLWMLDNTPVQIREGWPNQWLTEDAAVRAEGQEAPQSTL